MSLDSNNGRRFSGGLMRHLRVTSLATASVALIAILGTASGCSSGGGSRTSSITPTTEVQTSASSSAAPRAPARTSNTPGTLSQAPADVSQVSSRAALSLLKTLPVKGRASKSGYARSQFGEAWTDNNDDPLGHNGCDTRNDILNRDLAQINLKSGSNGCVVSIGTLHDPYTTQTVSFRRGEETSNAVQIDHVVALADAWQTGAQQWSPRKRTDLANDPLNLLAVDGPTNESKGDGDAATWLPPSKAYRCAYVARQVAVKARYALWVTAAEHDAIARVLSSCPNQTAPAEPGAPPAGKIHASRPTQPSHTTAHKTRAAAPKTKSKHSKARRTSAAPVRHSCTTTSSGKCIKGGEFCPQAKYGQIGYDGSGRSYVCTGDRTHPHWE